ncbi:MAG: hypothetical protein E7376_00640 [Clostridiales bacterium]|nr:hypothetical protein [Clostridiales bacterium]
MELKTILEYQKQDAELIKLENELNNNKNKKIFTQMLTVAKDAQNKSNQLEKQAGELLKSYEQLKKTYEDNIKSANIVSNKKLETASIADLETIEEIAKTIINNLSILEKKLLAEAEKVNSVLNGFKQTKEQYNMAKDKYNKHKQLFDAENKELEPTIAEKTKAVKKLEAGIDAALLTKYKQRRQDRIFPVFVPCIDKACGGCRMELPSANLSTLKTKGVLECEHCRRIIYLAD